MGKLFKTGFLKEDRQFTASGKEKGLSVNLFSFTDRILRAAVIDRLEIRPMPGISQTDYDGDVTAVDISLSDFPHRSRKLKHIPVKICGNPPITENTKRILKKMKSSSIFYLPHFQTLSS